jgi:hypothetical protein
LLPNYVRYSLSRRRKDADFQGDQTADRQAETQDCSNALADLTWHAKCGLTGQS